jgi:hypothetical protein
MKTNYGRLTHVTIATGTLILALATATPSFGSGTAALNVRAVAVHGNRVSITVTNESVFRREGIVTSRVLLKSGSVVLTTSVAADPGQTVTVDVTLPSKVADGVPTGVVVDDGVPF